MFILPHLKGLTAGSIGSAAFKNAALDLNFASNKSLIDSISGSNLVTFTRASSGTFVGSDGLLKTATTNEARFDHNPTTGESLGLLVEEQRTNSIRNNTGVGAAAGTPGTDPTNWSLSAAGNNVTKEVVGLGTENGIPYVDIRYSGTPTAGNSVSIAFEPTNFIAAASGQTWTESVFIKLQAGSFSGTSTTLSLLGTDGTAGTENFSSPFITSTPTNLQNGRLSVTATFASASTTRAQPRVRIGFTVGVAFDITLRIGLPQLEQGAFATSPILTTTAAATRSADVPSITGANFSSWYNQTEGTMFANATAAVAASILPCYASIDNGTTSERLQLRRVTNGTSPSYRVVAGGQSIDSATKTIGSPTGFNSHVLAYASSNYEGACNGTLEGLISIVNRPTATQLQIGNGAGSTVINGTIKRLTYWPTRLGNTTLQQITQ